MQTKDKISDAETRWKIASDFADYLPHAFDNEFRKISEGRCDAKIKEAELNIWKNIGSMQKKYAKMLNCPLKSAMDVANAFAFISNAMFGPELKAEIKDEKNDIARITCNSCPMVKLAHEKGTETRNQSEYCRNFSNAAIKSLNPAYNLIVQKSICNSDKTCEILIVKNKL